MDTFFVRITIVCVVRRRIGCVQRRLLKSAVVALWFVAIWSDCKRMNIIMIQNKTWVFLQCLSDPLSTYNIHNQDGEMAKNVQFRTVTGQRGSVLILDELGYNYRKMSTSTKTGTILWRCCKCNVLNCPALVRTSGDFIILQKNHHNH